MSLRLRLNLAMASLSLAFLAVMGALQLEATRRSVREEVMASSRIATQLLEQVDRAYAQGNKQLLLRYLGSLGRVRSNEISLITDDGLVRYRSPPSPYRAGERAPEWFAALVTPPVQVRELRLQDATLRVVPDPSRAILDGWNDVQLLLGSGGGFVLMTMLAMAWLVSRATAPFARIENTLIELERGKWDARVPPVRGREARRIRDAINRVAEALPLQLSARAAELAAREQLQASRAFAEQLQVRIEREKASLARELHDEFGQSITAIRSLARAIGQRAADDPSIASTASLIFDTAGESYAGMQRLIGKLRPMALDTLGLAAALEDLMTRWRSQPGMPQLELAIEGSLDGLPAGISLAAFRIVQEALGNALRHARASRVRVLLQAETNGLTIRVEDDGVGITLSAAPQAECTGGDPNAPLRGGFGLRSMRERAEAAGGRFSVGPVTDAGGTRVQAWLPRSAPQPSPETQEVLP